MVSLRVRIVLLCAAAAVLIPQALGSITRHENIALKCGGRSAMVGVNTTHLTKEMSQSDLICHPAFFTARNDKNICHEPFTFVQRITYQVRAMVVHKYLHPATVAVRVLSLHCNHGVTSRVADAVTDTVMEDGMLAPTREASCPSGQFVRAVQLEVADIPDQLLTSAGGRVECTDADFDADRQHAELEWFLDADRNNLQHVYDTVEDSKSMQDMMELMDDDEDISHHLLRSSNRRQDIAVQQDSSVCGPFCKECLPDGVMCTRCMPGFYLTNDGASCVPCGVNDCATCGNTRDPATMCHACLPGYVLLLPTATNTSDRCVQGNTLGQPDPTQTNATIIAAVADTTPLAKFCAPHLRASCASCAPQTPSECSTCAVGFTKLGKRCVLFDETNLWQRHFFGFNGRKIDVVNFEAGKYYNLLSQRDVLINARFDGVVLPNNSAQALTREVAIQVGTVQVHALLTLGGHPKEEGMEVMVNGLPVLTRESRKGSLQTGHYSTDLSGKGPSQPVYIKTMVLAAEEVVTVEAPFLTVTVTRRGNDLALHVVSPQGLSGNVHGIIGRTMGEMAKGRPLSNVLLTTSFVQAGKYQVSGAFRSDFMHNEFAGQANRS